VNKGLGNKTNTGNTKRWREKRSKRLKKGASKIIPM
jgi:hypothetical protein